VWTPPPEAALKKNSYLFISPADARLDSNVSRPLFLGEQTGPVQGFINPDVLKYPYIRMLCQGKYPKIWKYL
jgi:hypothetical protein